MKNTLTICAAILAAQIAAAQSGLQWEYVPNVDTTLLVSSFAVQEPYLFIAGRFGIYRTSDDENWAQTGVNAPENRVITAMFASDGYLLCSTDGLHTSPKSNGIYRSTDYGTTWTITGMYEDNISCFTKFDTQIVAGHHYNRAIVSDNNGLSWGGKSDGNFGFRAMCATDSAIIGVEFNQPAIGIWYNRVLAARWNISNFKDQGLTLYSGNGVLLVGALNEGVYRSTNHGQTWGEYNIGMIGGNTAGVSCYSFHSVGNVLYAGTTIGLYYSTNNGARWNKASDSGLNDKTILILTSHGKYLFAGTKSGFYRAKLPSVGVEEIAPVSEMKISPNPAAESFTVHIPPSHSLGVSGSVSLTVRDVFGRVTTNSAGNLNLELGIRNGEATFSTADYPSGVYFVEVSGADGRRVVGKVVISR